MMSCCGCASRVLKLQSEIRSWKTRLGNEKREKKMMLRWMLVVFGYDVRVELEKESHVVRLQATENKEAMSKAIIKSVIGSEDDCGVMLMEVKLEENEYYEPFEEPDVPEFPILEINSMATSTQPALLSAVGGGMPAFSHLMAQQQQHHYDSQNMSITTPMEVASLSACRDPITGSGNPEEVLYLAGNLEEGATLEGPNGQSYIIVRAAAASNNEEVSAPMMECSAILNNSNGSGVIRDVYYGGGDAVRQQQQQQQQSGRALLNYPTLPKPASPPIIKSEPVSVATDPQSRLGTVAKDSGSPSLSKKTTATHSLKSGMKTPLKRKASDHEMDIKIKSVSSRATSFCDAGASGVPLLLPDDSKRLSSGSLPAKRGSFGLTLREKAEIYVIQKAREVVEKLPNATGFRCTACSTTDRVFPSIEYATGHAKTHFESKPYKCESCDQLFPIQKELLNHRKAVHPKPNRSSHNRAPSQPESSSIHYKSSNTTSAAPAPRSSSSGTTQIYNSTTSTTSSTKTVTVHPPFDKKLISGPISVSNEVLAAILGAGVRVTFSSSSNSDNCLRNLSRL